MAPADTVSVAELLAKRSRCGYDRFGQYYCYSRWYWWGRWVLLGAALLVFGVVLLCCCCTARRRRRRGAQPIYGTGWMAPPPKYGSHQNDYQLNQQGGAWNGTSYQNPPAYGGGAAPQEQQYTGTTFNQNDGYYGNHNQQQYGVQSPGPTYQGNYVYPPAPNTPAQK